MRAILVTGGAGFIGSNFVRYMLDHYPDYRIVVFDKLTYAGNLDNLREVQDNPRYCFVQGDIADRAAVDQAIQEHTLDTIVNFAAETHVDRSILTPDAFIYTDVVGTYTLLEATREHGLTRLVQISTDEVYGSVSQGFSSEEDRLRPRSPYSATKAGAELLVQAFHTTYNLPVVLTRGSNTIGPYQYPEKVVPLWITNALEDQSIPIYGDGRAMRDYLYVVDHCEAIDRVLHQGVPGEVYNIGAGNEINGLELADRILTLLNKPKSLAQFVTDRPGHDRRYALDCSKIHRLGWRPRHNFEQTLCQTVKWYSNNRAWWKKLKQKQEYQDYYRVQYEKR